MRLPLNTGLFGRPSVAGLLPQRGRLLFPSIRDRSRTSMEGTVVKRLFVAAIFLVGLMASAPAQAAPILVPTADTVLGTFTVDFVGGTSTVVIAGTSPADIVDGAVVLSGVIDADVAPGTDDAVFLDLVDEVLLFDFDIASAAGLGTPSFTLLVAGSGVTPITDPALAAFLAANNIGLF